MNGTFGMPWFAFSPKRFFLYAPLNEGEGGGADKDEKDEGLDETLDKIADKVAKDMGLDADGKKKDDKKDDKKSKDKDKDDEDEDEDDEDDEDDDDDDDEDDEDEDLNESQLAEAKTLFKVLNGPKAKEGLIALVRAAGLDLKEGETTTKKEEKKITKTIKEVVKEKLGKKYEFLSEDLGDLLQELFEEFKEEATSDIRKDLSARNEKEVRAEIASAYQDTIALYDKVPNKVLKEVLRIQQAEEMTLGPKTDPRKYFKAVVVMAAENLGVTLVKKQASSSTTSKQATRKADRTLSDLNNRRQKGGAEHKSASESARVKTLDEIIKDSAAKVEEQMATK